MKTLASQPTFFILAAFVLNVYSSSALGYTGSCYREEPCAEVGLGVELDALKRCAIEDAKIKCEDSEHRPCQAEARNFGRTVRGMCELDARAKPKPKGSELVYRNFVVESVGSVLTDDFKATASEQRKIDGLSLSCKQHLQKNYDSISRDFNRDKPEGGLVENCELKTVETYIYQSSVLVHERNWLLDASYDYSNVCKINATFACDPTN